MTHTNNCKQTVQKSEHDSDSHGRFYRTWNEDCGKPVHRYCLEHFKAHIRMLEHMAKQRARANRAELARLTEPTKPG